MVVEELVALLGFEFDDKDLKKFDEGMNGAKSLLVGVGVAAVASAGAIFAFTKSIAETNDEIGKNAQILGMATAELQAWQFAAELGGSSVNAMTSSLQSLSRKASEASRGMGAGVEVFGILGISATQANGQIKDSSLLLEEVADKVSQLGSQAQKLEFLEKLGISSDLLLTLDQGSAALRKQRLEAEQLGFTLSESAAKDAAEFNDEFLRIGKIVQGVSNSIAHELMPGITELMTAFKEWFIANKKIIQQNFKRYLEGIQKVIGGVWSIAKRLFRTVDTLIQAFGGWEKAITLVGAALLLMNAKALLIPITFIAIAAGIALLLEDIATFIDGGDSVLGDLLEKFPLLKQQLEGIVGLFKQAAKGWGLIFTEGENALEGLGILLDKFGEKVSNLPVISQLITLFTAIKDLGLDLSGIQFGGGKETGIAPAYIGNVVAPAPLTNNNQSASVSTTNNFEINVTGTNGSSTAASDIKREINKVLSDQNRTAQRNLRGSVAR